MLFESPPPATPHKRIGLITRDASLEGVLRGLFTEWGYLLPEVAAENDLLLVQEGCLPPAGHNDLLWLTSSHYEGSNRLHLPVPVEELWRHLESRHHKPPRNHIRLSLQHPATVEAHGESTPARIISLSDLGLRFEFPREMVSGETLSIETTLDGERLVLQGRVIYVVPRGDLEGTGRSEIGLVFSDTPQETRMRVRECILCHYLETVRRKMDAPLFAAGLDFLQLPAAVLRRLGSR